MIQLEPVDYLETLIQQALPRWNITPEASLKLLSYSENATFLVSDEGQKWVLRVNRPDYHTENGIRSELAWMKALREETGLETPLAIEGLDGDVLQFIDEPKTNTLRTMALFHFIEGKHPESEDLVAAFNQLGAMTAKLHVHAKQWKRPEYFERLHWDLDGAFGLKPNWGHWKTGFAANIQGIEIVEKAAAHMEKRLHRYGQSNDRYGLIHSDFRTANLFVHEGKTKILDFDDCGFGWYLYDLASSMTFLELHEQRDEIIHSWLDGYLEVAPLSEADLAEIPVFMLLRRLVIMGWAGSHPDTELAQEMGVQYTIDTIEFAKQYLAKQVFDHQSLYKKGA